MRTTSALQRPTLSDAIASSESCPTGTRSARHRFSPSKTALLTAAAVAALGSTLLASSPAQASAVGCTRFGTHVIDGFTVYAGQYCFGVNGSGTTINFTDGSVETPAIYNRSEYVSVYDNHGNLTQRFYEPESLGYTYGYHYWQTTIHGTAPAGGRICGTLTSSGADVATACEGIG